MEEKVIVSRNDSGEISLAELMLKLHEWYNYLLSKWVIVLISFLFGGTLGFTYVCFKKTLYKATTTFVLDDANDDAQSNRGAGIMSMISTNGGSEGIFQGDNILELYKSRIMIKKTLLTNVVYNNKRELLIERYIVFNKMREKWAKVPDLKNIQFKPVKFGSARIGFTRLQDSILGVIVEDINKSYLKVTKANKKLNLIRVDVEAPDEFFAKTFDEEIVKNVSKFYINIKLKTLLKNVAILQKQTDSVQQILNHAIYSSAVITDATPNLSITHQEQLTAPVQRAQLTRETNKFILVAMITNLEFFRISLKKEAPLIQIIDRPVFPLEITKMDSILGAIIGVLILGFLTIFSLLLKKEILKVINI